MPRFSVVVPVYNAEKYLEECIESVLSQSFKDLELILIDDGSPDSSGHICDCFAALDKRIKVIHQKNQGHITARMNGVKAAKGEYILFLDSDDYWLPDAFLLIDEKIKKHNCDMLIFLLQKGSLPYNDFFSGEKDFIPVKDYLVANLSHSQLNPLVIKAISRKLFEGVDISDFAHFLNSEDLLLTVELVKHASKISYFPKVLYYYRENPCSITHSFNENGLDEFIYSRKMLMCELEKLGCANAEKERNMYTAFLHRAADTVLQISACENLTKTEKIVQYKKIADMPFFAKAIVSVDLSKLSNGKALRIKLLQKKQFMVLYLTDRLRLIVRKFAR